MKRPPSVAMRKLRADLRYWQAQTRLDLRAARLSMARARAVGAKMRALTIGVSTGKLSKRAKAKA